MENITQFSTVKMVGGKMVHEGAFETDLKTGEVKMGQRNKGRIKFREFGYHGDDNFKLISIKKFHNYDWHYWLVLSMYENPDHESEKRRGRLGDTTPKYFGQLEIIAPEAVPDDGVVSMAESYYGPEDRCQGLDQILEMVADFSFSAPVFGNNGNNKKKLMLELKDQAHACNSLFGFYMDRPVNRIGATGWDAVSGDMCKPLWGNREPDPVKMAQWAGYLASVKEILKPLTDVSRKIRKAQGMEE